ncbi:MAG TPA: tetratricopeptide repeat protein [Pseudonocardia sp.]|nr:tetratricopeptide repeat protein [Pseudonocardia sp.]
MTGTPGAGTPATEWAQRVEHLRAVGRLDRAEEVARTALAANPQDPALLGALSAVLLNADRPAEGLAAAEAAVAARPDDERAHRLRSLHLARLGRHAEAVEAADRCVALLPDEPAPASAYARALQGAGRHQEAVQVAHRVVEMAPDVAGSHLLLADISSELRDRRSRATARAAYERTLRLDPENVVARHDLALLDLRARRPARALRGLLDAGRLAPAVPEVLRTVTAVMWVLSWRLRLWLIVATVGTLAAAGTATGSRTAGAVVLAASAGVAWWTARDLPARTLPVVRAAVRADRPLTVTYVVLGLCLLQYVLVVASGVGMLAAAVWLLLIGLGWLALLVRFVRWLRR